MENVPEELAVCIRKGDVAKLDTLIKGGLDVNAWYLETNGEKVFPLHQSIKRKNACFELLLKQPSIDINLKSEEAEHGVTPLAVAAAMGYKSATKRCQMLIDRGADIHIRVLGFGHLPLHFACASGLGETVRLLCDRETVDAKSGPSIYKYMERFPKGSNSAAPPVAWRIGFDDLPHIITTEFRNSDAMSALLDYRESVGMILDENEIHETARMALLTAMERKGNFSAVTDVLLKRFPNEIARIEREEWSLLPNALGAGYVHVAKILLQKKVPLFDMENSLMVTCKPLMSAIKSDQESFKLALKYVKKGVVNMFNKNPGNYENQPLFQALKSGHHDRFEALISKGFQMSLFESCRRELNTYKLLVLAHTDAINAYRCYTSLGVQKVSVLGHLIFTCKDEALLERTIFFLLDAHHMNVKDDEIPPLLALAFRKPSGSFEPGSHMCNIFDMLLTKGNNDPCYKKTGFKSPDLVLFSAMAENLPLLTCLLSEIGFDPVQVMEDFRKTWNSSVMNDRARVIHILLQFTRKTQHLKSLCEKIRNNDIARLRMSERWQKVFSEFEQVDSLQHTCRLEINKQLMHGDGKGSKGHSGRKGGQGRSGRKGSQVKSTQAQSGEEGSRGISGKKETHLSTKIGLLPLPQLLKGYLLFKELSQN